MKYRDLQPVHEKSVLNSFKQFLLSKGQVLTIINQPDPPDALIQVNSKPSWIEITDAFQNIEWAKSITSYAADDKPHQPYNRGTIYEPDMGAVHEVCAVILKKYQKETMKNLLQTHGQGILLVGAYTPLTSIGEIIHMSSDLIAKKLRTEEPIFSAIYIYQNSFEGHEFAKLL